MALISLKFSFFFVLIVKRCMFRGISSGYYVALVNIESE